MKIASIDKAQVIDILDLARGITQYLAANMNKSRKELLRNWPSDRVEALLRAEQRGKVEEVVGGWLIEGEFYEKFPFKGELLTSYLEMLAENDDYH